MVGEASQSGSANVMVGEASQSGSAFLRPVRPASQGGGQSGAGCWCVLPPAPPASLLVPH